MKCYVIDYYKKKKLQLDIVDISDSSTQHSTLATKAIGVVGQMGDSIAGLLVYNGLLYILYDGRTTSVFPGEVFSTFHQDGERRVVHIVTRQRTFNITYINLLEPVSTMYYSEDQEDVDFGLWLNNILNSQERQSNLIRTWCKGIDFECDVADCS